MDKQYEVMERCAEHFHVWSEMMWDSRVVDRETLYQEVWTQPMTTVAKEYGLSNVALRKVCLKLEVPVPKVGHWAKVRSGKRVLRPVLPATKGPVQHHIRRWVEPAVPEMTARLSNLVVNSLPVRPVTTPRSVDECQQLVKNTDAALQSGRVDEKGRLLSAGPGCCDVRVTPPSRTRAVLLCELLIRTCVAAGLTLKNRVDSADGPQLKAGEIWHTWRVTESGVCSALAPERGAHRTTAAGRRKPPPNMRIDFLSAVDKRVVLSFLDSAKARLEARLWEVSPALLRASAVAKAKADFAEEQRLARDALERDRIIRIALRMQELERLRATEDLADRFRRAEALRAYGEALRRQSFENELLDAAGLAERLRWMKLAADWLDPTTRGHWPEVDDAPDSLLLA